MKPKQPGTILPNWEQVRKADQLADRQQREQERAVSPKTTLLERRVVGGETRFYKGPNVYAVVSSRTGKLLWFQTNKVGEDYAIGQP